MKRLILGIVFLGLLSSSAFAKKVSVCTAYLISATAELECSGDFSGKSTMVDMYKKCWTIASDVGGSRKFIIIFEK
ncbi:MAG: hypothetical protein ACQERD_10280 [Campylobacterota bacterium]